LTHEDRQELSVARYYYRTNHRIPTTSGATPDAIGTASNVKGVS